MPLEDRVEPDELLSKADALMDRHRKPRTAADPSVDIPVLTEVVEVSADGKSSGDSPVLTELPNSWRAAPSAPAARIEDESIETLAIRIRAALLTELQPQIDRQLEERLKVALEPLVEKMFTDLRDDLRTISREVLTESIRSAVERELDRHKSGS